jgi:predicted metal-dependent phosphoesterase TrpH
VRGDLHVHSTASDGTVAPGEIVRMAHEIGLDLIALADHDSVEGVASAIDVARDLPVTVVPAVELSSFEDGHDVHILGYFIDHEDPHLTEELLRLRHARLERAIEMVSALREAGFEIAVEDVVELALGGSVGRSHIARALVDSGGVGSVADAFQHLIGRGGPYYVRKPLASPGEVVGLIRDAGGLPVLAHPGVGDNERLITPLLDAGLAGIEAYHFEHDETQTRRFAELADSLGILATGGSDYHGPNSPGPGLGMVQMPDHVADRLLAADPR